MTDVSTSPSWHDLLHEHRTEVFGALWLDLLHRAVRSATPHYPPSVYSETGEWNDHARENLVQVVALDQLLAQGQLEYIIATATSTESAAALLHRVVRRTLARSRRRTVIDNLLDRARALRSFAPASGAGASNDQVLAAARAVAQAPRVHIHSDERAPAIYTTATLKTVLQTVDSHLGPDFSERDLARILEHVLTSYLPSALIQGDGRSIDASSELTPDQEAVVADVLSALLTSMTPEQSTIVAMKLADHSDTVVAQHIGVSRPTAAKRFKDATAVIEEAVVDLPSHLQDAVLAELVTHLEPHNTFGTTNGRSASSPTPISAQDDLS